MNDTAFIRARSLGALAPRDFVRERLKKSSLTLQLSATRSFVRAHQHGVTDIDVDHSDGRYLLSADAASICIFDLDFHSYGDQQKRAIAASRPECVAGQVLRIGRGDDAHRYVVSTVQWYPHDTGMFVSGSYDHSVLCWDTNAAAAVMRFVVGAIVNRVAINERQPLIATAAGKPSISLCDMRSGSAVHSLVGHDCSEVCSVAWSPTDEFLLCSGGSDGRVLLWDTRKATSFLRSLDMANTQGGADGGAVSSSSSTSAHVRKRRREASEQRARAHGAGAVSNVLFTPDGVYLLSTGGDARIRRWVVHDGRNTLVNFANASTQRARSALMCDGEPLLLQPSGKLVSVYNAHSGQLHGTLRGHFNEVSCCAVRAARQQLLTGGGDRSILAWVTADQAKADVAVSIDSDGQRKHYTGGSAPVARVDDEDEWSDDSDDDDDDDDDVDDG